MYACRRSALQRIVRPSIRSLATSVSGSPLAPSSALNVFDAGSKLAQRNRAAADPEQSRLTDYVRDELAAVMVDRLLVLLAWHLFVVGVLLSARTSNVVSLLLWTSTLAQAIL